MAIQNKQKNPKIEFLINLAYFAAIIALAILVLKYCVSAMFPILLAFAIASIARPLAHFLSKETKVVKRKGVKQTVKRKFHLQKRIASIVSVIFLLLVVSGLITFFTIEVADTVSDMVERVPAFYSENIEPAFSKAYDRVMDYAEVHNPSNADILEEVGPQLISNIGSFVTTASTKLLGFLATLVKSLPTILLDIIICIIATVFIAVDYDSIMEFLRRNLPAKALVMTRRIRDSFLDIVWQFLKSYFIIFCITVTEITVGLLIIGVKHPLMIAVLIGIFDAFPIVGSGMILLPWSVITLLLGYPGRGIGLFILYATVVIVRQFMEPKIVGKRVGLRPIVTLTCMYAGTKIIGGIGLFALPITMAILVDLNASGVISLFRKPGDRPRSSDYEEPPMEDE